MFPTGTSRPSCAEQGRNFADAVCTAGLENVGPMWTALPSYFGISSGFHAMLHDSLGHWPRFANRLGGTGATTTLFWCDGDIISARRGCRGCCCGPRVLHLAPTVFFSFETLSRNNCVLRRQKWSYGSSRIEGSLGYQNRPCWDCFESCRMIISKKFGRQSDNATVWKFLMRKRPRGIFFEFPLPS